MNASHSQKEMADMTLWERKSSANFHAGNESKRHSFSSRAHWMFASPQKRKTTHEISAVSEIRSHGRERLITRLCMTLFMAFFLQDKTVNFKSAYLLLNY